MALPTPRFFSYIEPHNAVAGHARQAHDAAAARKRTSDTDADRARRQSHDARRGAHLALRLSATARGTRAGAVRGLAPPPRLRHRACFPAVSLARDRTDRVVRRTGLRLC